MIVYFNTSRARNCLFKALPHFNYGLYVLGRRGLSVCPLFHQVKHIYKNLHLHQLDMIFDVKHTMCSVPRRKRLHESKQLKCFAFGDFPADKDVLPPIKIVYSDIPCILFPYLQKHDPEVLEHISIQHGNIF